MSLNNIQFRSQSNRLPNDQRINIPQTLDLIYDPNQSIDQIKHNHLSSQPQKTDNQRTASQFVDLGQKGHPLIDMSSLYESKVNL